ncbi:MAG TPA: polysaccharide biosynthesis/export family protein [Pyrinomonadaceae bacterium]|nr:polysaccharide biosynthesis/export family protein [Pyrinomonadaceae bacterium]
MSRIFAIAALLLAGLPAVPVLAQQATGHSSEAGKASSQTQPALLTSNTTNKGESKPSPSLVVPNSPATSPNSDKLTSEPEENSLTTIYRVGVGDVLDVRVRNTANSGSTLFTVLEGGVIEFPLLGGAFSVVGYTTEEIQNRMAVEFRRRALLDGAQISVAVRQYASHSIIVTGLVVSGGTKMLRREAVPLYVILAESQSRLDAARASIMRANNSVLTVDLTDPSSTSVLVRPGDVINIMSRPELFYYIGGRIDYPGQKVFQSGITLLQSILAAGGTRKRSDGVVEMSRESSSGNLTTTRYNLKEIKSGKVPDPKLQAGDRIEVLK